MQNKKEYVSLRSSCTVKRIPFQSCILFSFASTPSSISPDDFCLFPKKCISFRNNSHIFMQCNRLLVCTISRKKDNLFFIKCRLPRILCAVPSSSSIPQKLVVFCHALTPARCARLDLAGIYATARSAIVVSSVSPERWDTIAV